LIQTEQREAVESNESAKTSSRLVRLTIHGVTAEIVCKHRRVLDALAFDFDLFLDSGQSKPADLSLAIVVSAPPYESIPPLDESMRTSQWICFDDRAKRYIDYNGKALVVYDFDRRSGTIYAGEWQLAYERAYLVVLSRVGEELDRRGMHRVHAMGVAGKRNAAILLMTARGGKSTLAISLLARPTVKLISDDTVFIDRAGGLHSFPFRLGVRPDVDLAGLPDLFVRQTEIPGWGSKLLVNARVFADRIWNGESRRRPIVMIGCRTTADSPRCERTTRLFVLICLLRDCVVGLGLPQVAELFLRRNFQDVISKAVIAGSRLFSSLVLAVRCEPVKLYMCKHAELNSELVMSLLDGSAPADCPAE
jgi:hypothetical protein